MGLTGGKSGGKNALAARPNLLNALQVQTSSYGQVIPIVYGQNRIAGRLLWSGDFQAIAHTSTQKVGGKGLGSSSGNVSQTTYSYQTAVAIGLCMGPIQNLGTVWDTKGQLTLLSTSVQYTVPGGGGSFMPTPPGGGIWHSGRGVSRTDSYSLGVNDYGSDGLVTLSGTQQTPMLMVSSNPGAGQFALNGMTGQHTFSPADAGKVMTITYAYSEPTSSSATGAPATTFNLTLFLGQRPQTPWSYLTSAHPGQDLGYNGIAYVASAAMDLGTSGALPNLSYEILGLLPFGGGITDAEPSAVISDLINNPYYGLNGAIPLDTAVTVANYSSYCIANGIFISPVYDAQQTAAKCIQDILDLTNAEAVWSEGVLKIRSYGDTTAIGNGATFSPTTSPIYDLTSDHFLDVVTIKRPSAAEVMNSVSVEFSDRANSYNVAVAEDKDEAQIAIYGLRKAQPKTAHAITSSTVAAFVANLLRKREVEVRNTYTVKLGWQFALLEPMDLVTLTIPELGYAKKPVRITAIREDGSGQLEVDCEDFPWGTATPTLYAQQTPSRFAPQINADPGNVNSPIVFEAPTGLSKSGQHEIWMSLSGANPNWGGCSVWVSQDNNEYHQIGRIYSCARMGTLTANVAAGSDPDSTNFFPVDLTESNGVLTSGTQADADSYRTLCYADGEFISYQNAHLTASNKYNVGQSGAGAVYVRRGLFGSQNVAHASGAAFVRLDDGIFVYVYDSSFLGKTIYLKFTSFNNNGLVEQSIANATAYQFIITGKYCQMETVSKNLLVNPGFETNQSLTPTTLNTNAVRFLDGWVLGIPDMFVFSGNVPSAGSVQQVAGAGRNSSTAGMIKLAGGSVIPANTNVDAGIASDPIPITPGETYSFGHWANITYPAITSPNFGGTALRLVLYSAAGHHIGELSQFVGNPSTAFGYPGTSGNSGWIRISCYGTIPSTAGGSVPAFARLMIDIYVANSASGSAYTIPGDVTMYIDDAWVFPQWLPTGDEIGKTGSVPVTVGASNIFSYTATTTSITWSWNFNAYRTDNPMTVANYNSSQAITGLTANTTYNFYPFIDENSNAVSMVATGGTGSPAWAHSGTNVAWTQEQYRGDHTPLSTGPMQAATPASGNGSGSGGGGQTGYCLRDDVLVEEKTRGTIAVRELRCGDWVKCPEDEDTRDGWAEVVDVRHALGREWVHTYFDCGDWVATTAGHPFTLDDGSMKRAAQLCFEDAIPWVKGVTFAVRHEMASYPATKVSVSIRSRRHVFYAGMEAPVILQHNVFYLS